MTKLEENDVWSCIILAWLLSFNEEKIRKIKIGVPEDNKELRNLIQEKINKLKGEY